MSNYTVLKCTQGTQLWHDIRRQGIGASDAAAVLNVSKWKTAVELWNEKVNGTSQDSNIAMERGLALEPIILKAYNELTSQSLKPMNAVLRSNTYPFMQASLDAEPIDCVVEIKTASRKDNWGEPNTDQVPNEYIVQVQHSMIVTGLERAQIVVMFGFNNDIAIYEVAADKELQEQIIKAEMEFWDLVQRKIPPEPATLTDCNIVYSKSKPEAVTISQDLLADLAQLYEVREQIEELTKQKEMAEMKLKTFMKDAEVLVDEFGEQICTWKAGKPPKKFDTKKFKAEQPELAARYTTEGEPMRRFLLK